MEAKEAKRAKEAKSSFNRRPEPGYKRTEVGVIPEDWTIETLGELGKWLSGGTPSMSEKTYWDGSIPWVSPKDMKAPRLHDASDHISEKALSNGTRLAPQNALLIVVRGMILAHSLPVARAERSLAFNQDIKALIARDSVDSDFLLWWFQAHRSALLSLTAESTHGTKRLPSEALFAQKIALPPFSEQKAIAEVLNKADTLVECFERLIAKKRLLKRGVMQELLTGKKRLPGFSRDWETKRLGDIATFFSGGTPSTSVADYYAGDIPWITSGDLNQSYIRNVQGRISKSGLENSTAKMVEANTLLIALYGATAGVTAISEIRAAINQAVLAIVPRCDYTRFLYFKLTYLKDWLITTYTQGGQPNLSGEIVKSVELSMPGLDEQVAIAALLSAMDAEVALLEAQLAKYRQIKQGLMQKLLTGRIRLV